MRDMQSHLSFEHRHSIVQFASYLIAHLSVHNGDLPQPEDIRREQVRAELSELGRVLWLDNELASSKEGENRNQSNPK